MHNDLSISPKCRAITDKLTKTNFYDNILSAVISIRTVNLNLKEVVSWTKTQNGWQFLALPDFLSS